MIEVQARVTNDEVQDQKTASYAYELLERLDSLAGKNPAPAENFARETASPSAAKTTPVKSRSSSARFGHANKSITDGYVRWEHEPAYRLSVADGVGLGFELPQAESPIVRNVRRNSALQEAVVAA